MFKRLPIKYKMTLWYGLLTMLLIAVFLPMLILTTHNILINHEIEELQQFYSQLSAQIETKGGNALFENEVPLPNDIVYSISHSTGSVIASAGNTSALEQFLFEPGITRTKQSGTTHWLLTDGVYQNEGQASLYIRIARPLSDVDRVIDTMKLISLVCIPVFLATAILGGLFVAKRSLLPIQKVIAGGNNIAKGNLSERIVPTGSRDEIGELIQNMNAMTDSLEIAFAREKQFTSDASHELRTPITIIMAYAENLLAGDTLVEDDRKAVETILSESQRVRHIISRLLTLTRGGEGRYPMQMEALILCDLIAGVSAQLLDRLEEKNIRLVCEVSSDVIIYGDQSLLTQMLLNLFENSVKYGKMGGFIQIAAVPEEDFLKLTILDNGIGISQENLPKIFERFFRADTVRDRSGSGLGLSIVKWIVAAHHGRIDVHSEIGSGTAFTIRLPLVTK